MKKSIFVLMVLLFICIVSSDTYAKDKGWYLSGNAGVSMLNDADLATFNEQSLEYLTGYNLVSGAAASISVSYDPSFHVGSAVGYDYGIYKTEVEFSHSQNYVKDINIRLSAPGRQSVRISENVNDKLYISTILFNGYIDICKDCIVQPYVTAGVGGSVVSDDYLDFDDHVFTYQIGAGINYNITDTIALDTRYRYIKTSDMDVYELDVENSGHNINIGLRYYF